MQQFAGIGLYFLLSGAVIGQAVETLPKFDIADVHVAPRSEWVRKSQNNMRGGYLIGDRYELRRATMLDLIRTAYSIDADKVYGGPSWLDYDRFTITADAPPKTPPATLRLMLQSLLVDRFGLVVKPDSKAMPAYVLTVKDRSKLKSSDGKESTGCQASANLGRGATPTRTIQCHNVTMEAFASSLRRFGATFFDNLPVVDATKLEGTWDLDLEYQPQVTVFNLNGGRTTESSDTRGDMFGTLSKNNSV